MRPTTLLGSFAIAALLVIAGANCSLAQAHNKGTQTMGIRIGVHHFTTNENAQDTEGLSVKSGSKDGFAAEGFYNYYLLDQIAFEASLSSAHRGDITFTSTNTQAKFFGTANVYPISIGVKFAPLASMLGEKYQPFMSGGGSLVITREIFEQGRNVDLSEYLGRGEISKTGFGYWFGAGFDSFISTSFGLTGSFKYYSVKYDAPVAGYKDHSGWQITVGVSYLVRKK